MLNSDKKFYAIPTRFIVACTEGHIDEFPWDIFYFDIKHTAAECKTKKIFCRTKSTIGISGVRMRCLSCNGTKSFENIFSKEFSSQLVCSGKHYWKDSRIVEECKVNPRVLQRGSL